MKIKTALSASKLPGLDYSLNPYKGCRHACIYCYSPDVLRLKNWEEWGSFSEVKEGMPNLLAKELKRKKPGTIGIGTVTDPYQPLETGAKTTRYCLEQIARKKGWKVTIQTKSDLIIRDINIMREMNDIEVIITITTMDGRLAGLLEPDAPEPAKRMNAVEELSGAGIKTRVFLGPVIPELNDSAESLRQIIELAKDSGAEEIMFDRLRLKPAVKKRMKLVFGVKMKIIEEKITGRVWFSDISGKIEKTCEELDIGCGSAF